MKQKIKNQAEVLRITNNSDFMNLQVIADEVRSGDPNNREAVAARFYFPRLKDGYSRSEISPTSSILNYGYAVMRSTLARAVVSHGFITSVGLHHENARNEFNLVDDLIEPFRPMIDLQMLSIDLSTPENLSQEARRAMTSVLRNACIIGNKKTSCLIAAEEYVISFMKAVECRDASKLATPELLPIERID